MLECIPEKEVKERGHTFVKVFASKILPHGLCLPNTVLRCLRVPLKYLLLLSLCPSCLL